MILNHLIAILVGQQNLSILNTEATSYRRWQLTDLQLTGQYEKVRDFGVIKPKWNM